MRRARIKWVPQFESLDFEDAFKKFESQIGVTPTLVFIDQNGVKHLGPSTFRALSERPLTDFIFFVASSFKRRFRDLLAPEIEYPEGTAHFDAHRVLADVYRKLAPDDVHIGHFSIRKGSNIYGLIFGSHHWLGMFKFLEVAWHLDPECGEADFELEAECAQGQLFGEEGQSGFKKRKLEIFQDEVERLIESRTLITDADVFLHCVSNGFLPSRVAPVVFARMRKAGVLEGPHESRPRYSREAMKAPRPLLLRHGR